MSQISQFETRKSRSIEDKAKYRKTLAGKQEELSKKKAELAKEQSKLDKKSQQQSARALSDLQIKIKTQERQILKMRKEEMSSIAQLPVTVEKEYDFFISHASEDKESFVLKLANALKGLGAKVWLDKSCIKVGCSLRASIDEGLRLSRFDIVVISKYYVKKFWPTTEFNALFSKESAAGTKVILPIWHEISKDEVMKFSPMLADKLALNTSTQTVDEIASELVSLLNQ